VRLCDHACRQQQAPRQAPRGQEVALNTVQPLEDACDTVYVSCIRDLRAKHHAAELCSRSCAWTATDRTFQANLLVAHTPVLLVPTSAGSCKPARLRFEYTSRSRYQPAAASSAPGPTAPTPASALYPNMARVVVRERLRARSSSKNSSTLSNRSCRKEQRLTEPGVDLLHRPNNYFVSVLGNNKLALASMKLRAGERKCPVVHE
jgi:hypothetical protein